MRRSRNRCLAAAKTLSRAALAVVSKRWVHTRAADGSLVHRQKLSAMGLLLCEPRVARQRRWVEERRHTPRRYVPRHAVGAMRRGRAAEAAVGGASTVNEGR